IRFLEQWQEVDRARGAGTVHLMAPLGAQRLVEAVHRQPTQLVRHIAERQAVPRGPHTFRECGLDYSWKNGQQFAMVSRDGATSCQVAVQRTELIKVDGGSHRTEREPR